MVDVGPAGEDEGKGGKYLLLPPDFKGAPPTGYIAVRSETFNGYALLRAMAIARAWFSPPFGRWDQAGMACPGGVVAWIGGWWPGSVAIGRHPCSDPDPTMPFKANAARRHHIPKQKRKVTNWSAYDASLRQRGSLTVWFTDEAIAAWQAAPRTTRGGQPWYSPLAILTALTLRAVFRLALRQTEGLIGSIIRLLGLTLAVPDHSTLSRRAETLDVPQRLSSTDIGAEPLHLLVDSTGLKLCGAGEWLVEARRPAVPGASCTSAWMPTRARSLPPR
jgi:hypothetical protein